MATVGQLMTSNLRTISEETTIKEAAIHMQSDHVGSLLVKKEKNFIGIITETDVVRAVAEEGDLSNVAVAKMMSSPILTVEKKLSPHYARDVMAEKRIRHLGVTDEGEIVGVISARDLLAYFKAVSKEVA